MEISNSMVENLRKMAARDCADEDEKFNPMDYSGGNFDDAYAMGQQDGETYLARLVLLEIKG
jgi:hypothetical protein